MLDDFNRANEDPLSKGGLWARLPLTWATSNDFAIVSNKAGSAGAETHQAGHFNTVEFADGEVSVIIDTIGASLRYFQLYARIRDIASPGAFPVVTWNAYMLEVDTGATPDAWKISRWAGPTETVLATASLNIASGDRIKLTFVGSTLKGWRQAGGAGAWTEVLSATDATYTTGRLGMFKRENDALLDDFDGRTEPYIVTPKVEIAFATDPLAAVPTWTDVSQYVKGFTTKRGRPHELGRIDTGTATVALDNADRRFDPQNTSSPYSPNVLPLRKCRITLDDGLTAHRVFTGYVERWPMAWEAPGFESEMEISLVDGFEFLNAYDVETTKASLTTNLSGANNDLVFTAKGGGVEGNALSVVYHMGPVVSGHSTAPNVHFSPSETLQYKRDDGVTYAEYPPLTVIVPLNSNAGNALTTAHEIMAAVNSHHEASEYVSVSLAAGSDGSGQVTQMARTLLSGGEYVQELSGTRLGNVLDDISWPAAERSLDAGQSQVRAAGYDAKDEHAALQHVQETVAVEGSYAFMSGAGKVVFHDRHYRAKRPTSLATFGDGTGELVYEALTPSYDRDEIRNDIRVEMPNSQAGTASDATSKSRYGTRRERQSLPLTSVYEAQARADYLLYRYKDPGLRFESIRITPLTTADLWEQVLTREIGDRITVKRRPPEHPAGGAVVISQECFIEQVQLSLQTVPTSALVCDWQLSPADKDKFWILEDSVYGVLGTTARVGY